MNSQKTVSLFLFFFFFPVYICAESQGITYPWKSPRREEKRPAFFSKSISISFFTEQYNFRGESALLYPILLPIECQRRFEWAPWLHFCFSFTIKIFFSTSQASCHYGHSIFFLPLLNLTYCQVLFSGFGGLATTPIWR